MRVLCLALLAAAPAVAQQRSEFTELHLGMSVRVVLYAPDSAAARAAARAAFDRIAALEDVMSDWRPASELRRLEGRAGEWVEVSAELHSVLRQAVEIAAATDGAFDPTVAPLVALWREARRTGHLPSPDSIAIARALVGWERVSLDKCRPWVRLEPGTRLDLGGIAKGYIIQAALEVLRARGVARAMVAAGGDIAVGDAPPGRGGWAITVSGADSGFAASAAALANAALSTSGPGEQSVTIGGVRYSHVVDPRSGQALTNGVTVSVLAADAATADALATALSVLAPGRWAPVLERFPGVTAERW